jgi:hypothetical protein
MDKLLILRNKAKRLNFEVRDGFYYISVQELHETSNGAGPDWMASPLRKIISWFLKTFEATILVHDDEYQNSNGNIDSFDNVNIKLLHNGRKEAKDRYKWYLYPMRLIAYGKIEVAYLFCRDFGMKAWMDGFEGRVHRIYDFNKEVEK